MIIHNSYSYLTYLTYFISIFVLVPIQTPLWAAPRNRQNKQENIYIQRLSCSPCLDGACLGDREFPVISGHAQHCLHNNENQREHLCLIKAQLILLQKKIAALERKSHHYRINKNNRQKHTHALQEVKNCLSEQNPSEPLIHSLPTLSTLPTLSMPVFCKENIENGSHYNKEDNCYYINLCNSDSFQSKNKAQQFSDYLPDQNQNFASNQELNQHLSQHIDPASNPEQALDQEPCFEQKQPIEPDFTIDNQTYKQEAEKNSINTLS